MNIITISREFGSDGGIYCPFFIQLPCKSADKNKIEHKGE